MVISEIAEVLRDVHAEKIRLSVAEKAAELADVEHKAIVVLKESGLLEMGEDEAAHLGAMAMSLETAATAARISLSEAGKQIEKAMTLSTDTEVARRMGYKEEDRDRSSKAEEALNQARARNKEARMFRELCMDRIETGRMPLLIVK